MRHKLLLSCSAMLVIVMLAACQNQTTPPTPTLLPTYPPTLTSTPAPTQTPLPTQTSTPTSTPTPTPTPLPALHLGPRQYLAEAGFSFTPPFEYEVSIAARQIGVMDQEMGLIISFMGVLDEPLTGSAEEIVDKYIAAVFRRLPGDYLIEPAASIQVDGLDGQAFDLTGSINDEPFVGQAVFVPVAENQHLFGMGIINTNLDEDSWEQAGAHVFQTVLQSIQFTKRQTGDAQCPVSTDASYGFTDQNPIKVGGDFMDGPARERAYLDVLRGPNGEKIQYQRTGDHQTDSSIVDEYEITIEGTPGSKKLYLDEYFFEDPIAPKGFTCGSPIPLQKP